MFIQIHISYYELNTEKIFSPFLQHSLISIPARVFLRQHSLVSILNSFDLRQCSLVLIQISIDLMECSLETIGARIKKREIPIELRQFPSFEAISFETREFQVKEKPGCPGFSFFSYSVFLTTVRPGKRVLKSSKMVLAPGTFIFEAPFR